MDKPWPAQGSSPCTIFPITFMQTLLWRECTGVFMRMCHFEMTADPTGPLGSWRAWTEVADPCSWQSHSHSRNTERGLQGAHWSCSKTSVLEETSIEPPLSHVYAYVWIYVCIYKNIWGVCTSIVAVRKVAAAEQCHFMSYVGVFRNAQEINTRFAVKSSCRQDHDCKKGLAFYPSHS